MRRNGILSGRTALLLVFALQMNVESARAQYYQVGQVVSNFTVYARRPWTNLAGRVFSPGAPMQLTDFAGNVVFLEFFDPT